MILHGLRETNRHQQSAPRMVFGLNLAVMGLECATRNEVQPRDQNLPGACDFHWPTSW